MLHRRNIRKYGLDISPSVPIGPGLYIPHPVATVVAARKIGANVSLISSITIGMRNRREFPIIGDNVTIGTGARVLGGITIGDNALIGANAVVTIDVPANSTAVGIPAHILKPHAARTANEALRGIPDAAAAGTAPRYARKALRTMDSSELPAIRLHSSNGTGAVNGTNGANGAHGNGHGHGLEEIEEFEDEGQQELVTTGERVAFTIVRRPASGS
jgi:hypothetical protein